MEVLDLLRVSEIVIGLVVALITAIFSGFVWWDKRNRRHVDHSTGVISEGQERMAGRVDNLERDIKALNEEFSGLKMSVAQLPTARDMVDLKVSSAELSVAVRQCKEMVDTLYKAAWAADGRNS